jgi:uncharacterized protein (TIGR00369 family)
VNDAADPPTDAQMLARFQAATRKPRGSELLGFEMLSLDRAAMQVEIGFIAKPDFANPMGQVQGGYLCAMLDEAMSVAGVVASGITAFMPTLEMKTQFLRPVRADGLRLTVTGRVVKWGRTIAFTEGQLRDAEGKVCAIATATAMPAPFQQAKAAQSSSASTADQPGPIS